MDINEEKTLLEIEQLRQDIQMNMKKFEVEQKQFEVEQKQFDKKHHNEGLRLLLYGLAVGAGGTFAIAKTLQLLGASVG